MKIASTLRTLAAACAFAVASQAGAAVLQVNTSGILTGATGVTVGTKLYNVTFADGTCAAAFKGCVKSAFAFSTIDDVKLASQALLDQVFVDGPIGNFDGMPEKTFGCTFTFYCETFIPAYIGVGVNSDVVFGASSLNNFLDDYDRAGSVFGYYKDGPSATDTANYAQLNLAVFTLVGTAPEPSSIALMGMAMAGLALTRRRKA